MSDLRHDPINDQWVAIAKNRIQRPMEFVPIEQRRQQLLCPFCKGNEEQTPAAIAHYDENGTPLSDPKAWMVRVVPNKYPSFSRNGSASHPAVSGAGQSEICESNSGYGVQELIIPSPRHITSISELNDQELRLALKVAQDRIADLNSMDGVKHAMLFMNCRFAAGASLGHIHMQLIGSPVVSSHLQNRFDRDQSHRQKHGCSLIESLMNWEIEQSERIVTLTDAFCVVCPFASRSPFQVRIIPRDTRSGYLDLDSQGLAELAQHCRQVVTMLESQIQEPAYNLLLHLDPFAGDRSNWFVELLPRLTKGAGFELGTDIWVNPVPPESAAEQLRS